MESPGAHCPSTALAAQCSSALAACCALRPADEPTQALLEALQQCLGAPPPPPLPALASLRARLFDALHANPARVRLPQPHLRQAYLAAACAEAAQQLQRPPPAGAPLAAAAAALQALDTAEMLCGPHHALLRALTGAALAAAEAAAAGAGLGAPPALLPSLPSHAVAGTAAAAEALAAAGAGGAALPTLTLPSARQFAAAALHPAPRPVRLRGALAHWPALAPPAPGAPDRRWHSLAYLARAAGLRTVPVELGSDARSGGYVAAGAQFDVRLWRLGEYLEQVVAPSVAGFLAAGGGSGEGGAGVAAPYMAQHSLFDTCPQLARDICIPDYIYCCSSSGSDGAGGGAAAAEPPAVSVKAWLGPQGTYTPLHCDASHNMLAQVVGAKRVRLYAPPGAGARGCRPSHHLYPAPPPLHNTSLLPRAALAAVAAAGGSAAAAGAALAPFPLLQACAEPLLETVLAPGDLLFIPRGWWHEVEALTPSFSVSFWWGGEGGVEG